MKDHPNASSISTSGPKEIEQRKIQKQSHHGTAYVENHPYASSILTSGSDGKKIQKKSENRNKYKNKAKQKKK